ncbi:MAG: aspartate--tRNA(Asn) ligase, partial [Nitrosopumilaceae archaeon]|nr:aspartate--tRNA(Asn) ligase [Nitrosopumilaceae archaeon]
LRVFSEVEKIPPFEPHAKTVKNIDTRLEIRAIDLRRDVLQKIFLARNQVLKSIRDYFYENKFVEVNTPKMIATATEGGAALFPIFYYNKEAFLAQSPQLYKEQMTIGLERVFEISTFYRAEKSHTVRHLSEFTSVDIEAAFMDYTDVMGVLESLIVNVYNDVSDNCKKEQEELEIKIEAPSSPFERVTYAQALELLRKHDVKLNFGDDLQDAHLRILGKERSGFYFIVDWPLKLKPFYIHEKDDEPTLSKSFDLQYGYLELSSGGTRLHNPEKIKSRLKEQDLDPTKFADHLRAFEWGMPPHAGWGLGLDRLMATITKIDNIREVVLYPRDSERLAP